MGFSWYILLSLIYLTSLVLCADNDVADDSAEDGSYVIRLNRQKTPFEQYLNNAHILKKFGINVDWLYKKNRPRLGSVQDKRTNDSIALYRYLDNEFYGPIVMGHPGQTLNVAFDTAWSLSWVLSSFCHDFTNIGCWFHTKYDHTKSSGYKPDGRTIIVPEGKYNLSGYFSFDNISIAHSNVSNYSFVEMTSVPYTFLFNKVDGVLGLGLKNDSYDPFFYTLLKQDKIRDPIFCVYLNRDKQSDKGGNVILGFIEMRHVHSKKDANNNTIYDPIKYMPVKSGYFWQFDMDRVYVNQQKETPLVFCTSGKCNAITDTSSNNILGPAGDIDKIHIALEARPFFLDRYTINCETINKLPIITFTIGGQNFTLKGADYTVKLTYLSVTLCLTAFVPHDYTDFWVLGGAFLTEYYSIYKVDEKKVGFVKAA